MAVARQRDYKIIDAQIHAPDLPHTVHVDGLNQEPLLRALDTAGVDGCVIVPLAAPGDDVSAYNGPALKIAQERPDRFAVMGRFQLTNPQNEHLIANWRSTPRLLGMRISLVREPNLSIFMEDRMDWFWRAVDRAGLPVMVLVTNEMLPKVGAIAAKYPGVRLVVDHFGLTPYVIYDDLDAPLGPLLRLAAHPNVAVKASAIVDSVAGTFPWRILHEPIHRVVDAFGARRVFWGSDLTRLKCPYVEVVKLFTEELAFLTADDRKWIMGQALMDWIGWNSGPSVQQ
jgi:predicted TIM-barrel fold metal-dependent hydrolase